MTVLKDSCFRIWFEDHLWYDEGRQYLASDRKLAERIAVISKAPKKNTHNEKRGRL